MTSVKIRLVFFFFLIGFLSVAATGVLSARFFKAHYISELKDTLFDHGHTVAYALDRLPEEEYQGAVAEIARRLGGKGKIRITVVGGGGAVIADSEGAPGKMENHGGRPEIDEARKSGAGSALRMSGTVRREFLYAARKVKKRGGGEYFVRVAAPSSYIEEMAGHIRPAIFFAGAATLLLSFVFAWLIASRFTRPVQRLEKTSERIAAGDLSARSGLRGQDEFGRLGKAVDVMAESIQKNIEDIRQKKSEIEGILGSMMDGVIVTGTDMNILLVNRAAVEIFGRRARDYSGAPLEDITGAGVIGENVKSVLEDGKSREAEIEVKAAAKRVIDARVYPFRGEAGGITGAIVVVRDITRIKRLETVRTEFIENASHELRTPVSLIRGFVETLLGGAAGVEKDRLRFLELLDKESRRLMALTEDILTLERAEKRLDDLSPDEIDVARELAECRGHFAHSLAEKGLDMVIDLPPEPVGLHIPVEDFAQIFNNLIDNAIKFTHEGRISVVVEKAAGAVTIIVADTGSGIPEPDRERIFERFYRVDKSRSREKGGTGLGLSIVKHYVEKRGGSVSVESRLGGGAAFRVVFPVSGA